MQHPFIQDLASITDDELVKRISELNSRLAWCLRMGKGDIVRQISMAIESYQGEYNRRLAEQNKNNSDFQNKINIR